MSEERRISLAELLAREGGAPAAPAGGRRRRHRGGENSITVAELTGEIPVVRDDTPPPGAQADEQPAPEVPSAPQAPAAPAAPAAQAQQAYEPEVVTPEVVEPEAPAAPAAAEQAAPQQAAPVEQSEQADDDEPITSSFLAAAVADPGTAEAPADQAPEAQEPAVPEAPAEEAPAGREGRRSGLLRWGRGSRSAEAAPEQAPADEPAAQAEARAPEAPAAETPAAQAPAAAANAAAAADAPAEDGKDYAWSRWDQAEAPIMATADFNTAQVRERQSRFAEVEADDTVDVKPVAVPAADLDADAAAPDTASMSAQQIDDARADATPDFLAKPGDAELDEDADDEDAPPGKGRGWLALAAEVVLGLVAGAGLFYGFFKLWNWGGGKATIALTVVLAFIVIIGIVTFTHYLRKTTDYLTLGLALFVGLVITFGPLLMALGSN